MTPPFALSVPTVATPIAISLAAGTSLFVLGANGTGKSTLLHRFFTAHRNHARRVSAHRQTWFDSGAVSISGQERRNTENNIKSWDSSPNARWREEATAQRTSISLYDLVDAQNVRARAIADAFDDSNIALAEQLRQKRAPVQLLNRLLANSNIPIEISIKGGEELVASKLGATTYSVAELSDGERNVLLLAASILTAPENTLLLIDEPERHIHRSISSPLLRQLFALRPDCAFVVSTHDVSLAVDAQTRTILLRSCSHGDPSKITWDADLVDDTSTVESAILPDILGARRRVLFVEGTATSLDTPLYELLFPGVSIIPRSSCREVERSVVGIRAAEQVHWVRAHGIVDGDGRVAADREELRSKGIYALDVYSVESVYYHADIQQAVAARVAGAAAGAKVQDAMNAALAAIASHRIRLAERVAEKAVREAVLRALPTREQVGARTPIQLSVDVSTYVNAELATFDAALARRDVAALIGRYPVRETGALATMAQRLGFRGRVEYEEAVRSMLAESPTTLASMRDLFGQLSGDLTS